MAYYELGSDESTDEMIAGLANEMICLYCGNEIKDSVVYWAGYGIIVLHSKCARQLGQNFIFDSYAPNRKIQVMNILKDLEK